MMFILTTLLKKYVNFKKKKAKKKFNVALFDLDGTLWKSSHVYKQSFSEILKEYQHFPVVDNKEKVALRSLRYYFLKKFKYLSRSNLEEIIKKFQSKEKSKCSEIQLFAKVIETLQYLKDNDVIIGAVTARDADTTKCFLNEKKLYHQFFSKCVVTSNNCEDMKKKTLTEKFRFCKPSPIPISLALCELDYSGPKNKVVYIGDQLTDIECGIRAGCFTVHAILEDEIKKEMKNVKYKEDFHPNKVITRFDELQKILFY